MEPSRKLLPKRLDSETLKAHAFLRAQEAAGPRFFQQQTTD